MTRHYQITPVQVDGHGDANGVYENECGAWLGEVEAGVNSVDVLPYADDDGDFIPAPANWREMVVKAFV